MTARDVLERVPDAADGALAWTTQSESVRVNFENNRLKSVNDAHRTGLGVRVIADGQEGSSSSTDPADAEAVVGRALETAAFGRRARYAFPGPSQLPEVKVYDPALRKTTKEEMVAVGAAMMAILEQYNRAIVREAGVSKTITRYSLATSPGAAHSTDYSLFRVWIGGQWIRGTDMLWVHQDLESAQCAIEPEDLVHKAVSWFRLAEQVVPMPPGRIPVIFAPQAMKVLLLALVLGVNGKNVLLGSSPLAGRLGDRVADEALSITDDPLLDYAPGSAPFDSDGVPCSRTPVIEQGVLKNFLYDLDVASRAGVQSTGNAPGCWPHNLCIAPGDMPYEQMIADTEEGLLVRDVLALGQGNAISGAFSLNVELGYRIQKGRITGRVKDVMLAGNTYEALQAIDAIGDTAEWTGGTAARAVLTPPVKIGALSVTAK